MGLCSTLFSSFSTFVLDFKSFPFLLHLPRQIDANDLAVWIFPTANKFHLPWEGKLPAATARSNIAFNYADGSIRTSDEIRMMAPHRGDFKEAARAAVVALDQSNINPQHHRRLRLAVTAHNTFVLLFVAHTAMNWAQVEALPWHGKYEIDPENQGFRAVKYRAGGKMVSFRIEAGFLPMFKRFLELRDYLLNGVPCDTLFFAFGLKLPSPPVKLEIQMAGSLYKLLCRIDPQIRPINLREWRAAKADWLVRNTDPAMTALLLQNTERTVLRHYAAGSENQSTLDMSRFFDRLTDVVTDSGQSFPTKSAVGGCLKYGSPQSESTDIPIKPDCHQPEGCLFCTQFAMHADETDVRKLLSCRHCIHQTEHLADSPEQFQRMFGPVVQRIDAIILHVRDKSDSHGKLVDRIRAEVNDETRLDPYWEKQMEMLVSLGVVA